MCTGMRSSESYSVSAKLEMFAVFVLLESKTHCCFRFGVAKASEITCFGQSSDWPKLLASIYGLIAVELEKEDDSPLNKSPDRSEGSESASCSSDRTWLILPVVICLSQRLSHACLSISLHTAKLRMAH